MKLHSVFLRKDCILPDRFNPLREPCGDNWTVVQEITASVFDTIIRQTGWHFMWINGSSSRRSFGITHEDATRRALVSALKGLPERYNAAEFESAQVASYPGFHIANVTVQPRQIQMLTALDTPNEHPAQAFAER